MQPTIVLSLDPVLAISPFMLLPAPLPQVAVPTVGSKQCNLCRDEKDVSEFTTNSKQPDGLCSRCKLCVVRAGPWPKQPYDPVPSRIESC